MTIGGRALVSIHWMRAAVVLPIVHDGVHSGPCEGPRAAAAATRAGRYLRDPDKDREDPDDDREETDAGRELADDCRERAPRGGAG
mmetsp:Transcript_41925/g.94711  ORF Transcript_41925/g.94711 Transcript_41925/m.94711 type:complete len:86 (+) Transcript_41925:459-716(+)